MGVKLAGQAPVRRVLTGAGYQSEILDSAVRMRGVRVQGAEVQPVLLWLAQGSGGLYTVGLAGLLRRAAAGREHRVHMMDFTPATRAAHNRADLPRHLQPL